MPNRTNEFRDIVQEAHAKAPPSQPSKRKSKRKLERDSEASYDLYTKEAHRIYQHIDSLEHFLKSIRPAYLNKDARKTYRKRPAVKVPAELTENSLFAMFPSNIGYLTDQERDEIDFQAKVIIRRCMDRIKELEEAEKVRKEKSTQSGGLVGFLGSMLNPGAASAEDTLALHRSSITWLLNKKLTQVSQLQKDQQELRLTRELEKSQNQLFRSTTVPILDESLKPTKSTTVSTAPEPTWRPEIVQEEEYYEPMDVFEEQLSQEQLQALEKENSAMLEELNNTLNQVRTAEKALLEISTLQNELASHLAVQTMQTDRLYADSIATTERVEQGNLQLIKTRERNRGTRKFILFFLFTASFVLLFLDWYS